MNQDQKVSAAAVRDYMARTVGSQKLFKHWTGRLTYTEGVKFVAETCGAHWLIDAIASYQTKPAFDRHRYQSWILTIPPDGTSEGHPAVLVAIAQTNDGKVRLARQEIPYTDFPPDLSPFTLYADNGRGDRVLMLPREY